MELISNAHAGDQLQDSEATQPGNSLQLNDLPGTRLNTNRGSCGIVKVTIAVKGPILAVRAFGVAIQRQVTGAKLKQIRFMPAVSPREAQQVSQPGMTLTLRKSTCKQTGTRDCLHWPVLPCSKTATSALTIFPERFFIVS